MSAGPGIQLSGIRKSYGSRPVLDGLDLEVWPGEIVVLLGRNGAGKSTTAEVALGLRTADDGVARLLGRDARRAERDVRARVGATLERGGVPRQLRVREAVTLQASFWDDPLPPDALLERVGLVRVAQSPYRSLSAGERARLALALALVGRPEVLVLDEPTASMDIEGRHATWRILRELRADGSAVLLTTHLLEEAGDLADRVVVLHDGRAHAPEAGSATASRARGRLRLDAPASDAALARLRAAGVDVADDAHASYRLSAPSVDALLVELGRWLPASGRRAVALRVGPEEAAADLVLAAEADR